MLVYYYSEDGGVTRKGPYTASQLDKRRRQGLVATNARVWAEEYEAQAPGDAETKNEIRKTSVWRVVGCFVLVGLFLGIYLTGNVGGEIQTAERLSAEGGAPLPGLFPDEEEAESAISEEVMQNMEILQNLRIPVCCFEDTPVDEALIFISAVARKSGVMLNLMSETHGGPEPVIPHLQQEDVSALELLKAVCDASVCSFRVEAVGVFVYPKSLASLTNREEYQPQNEAEQHLLDALKTIMIPRCCFDGNSVDDAMMFLSAVTRDVGFSINYEYVGERDVVIPYLNLEQLSAYDLLRCICRRTGCVFWPDNGTVAVVPADELEY